MLFVFGIKLNKHIFQSLKVKISTIKFVAFTINLMDSSIHNFKKSINKRQHKKIYNLWIKNNKNISNTMVNISSKKIIFTENNALKYGLKHSILPKNIDQVKLRANIDTQIKNFNK